MCLKQDVIFRITTIYLNETLLLSLLYATIFALGALIAAHAHRLYSMIRLQQYLIQEKLPMIAGDDENIGKETAYRNTRVTGMTQGMVDLAAVGLFADPGTPQAGFQFDQDSTKEQITKIEEKMVPTQMRKLEKPKSLGLKKVNSGPRSVFLG